MIGVAADLREPAQAAAWCKRSNAQLGPVGVLVNSAGAARRTPPDELSAAHWHAAMDAKYYTYIHAIDAVLHGMANAAQVSSSTSWAWAARSPARRICPVARPTRR